MFIARFKYILLPVSVAIRRYGTERFLCLSGWRPRDLFMKHALKNVQLIRNHQRRLFFILFVKWKLCLLLSIKVYMQTQIHARVFSLCIVDTRLSREKNKKIFPVSAWVGSQSFVWLYECLYIVKEGLCAFFEFDWTTANNCKPKFEKSKMADVTAAEFTELEDRVKVVMGNLDQMFLLVMGCLIFCEYVFFVLCYSLKSFFSQLIFIILRYILSTSLKEESTFLCKTLICRIQVMTV